METKIITLEEGWDVMQTGITKVKRMLEGELDLGITSELYMNLYVTIYCMCTQKPPHDYSEQLYDRYRGTIEDYCKETVLPSLKGKHGEYMLKELVLRWSNHKVMVGWLCRFFYYIDRYFVGQKSFPTLKEVGMRCFRDLVYDEMKSKATEAVIALIHKEREGEEIDRGLLKNVLDIYVEIGMGQMERYEVDFERFMLEDTTSYYSRKASSWIHESEECLKKERERVSHYLHSSTEPKIVEALKEAFDINKTVPASS